RPRTGIAVHGETCPYLGETLSWHCAEHRASQGAARQRPSRQKEEPYEAIFLSWTGMLAGAAIGALTVSGLHAQGKPSVYLVTEIVVTDPDNYAKEFAPKAQATIKSAGDRFVVLSDRIRSTLGQPVIVENVTGAGGTIGLARF